MANYCVECKFAGKTSGSEVFCNKHQEWMDKYASCSDYKWVKARSPFWHAWLLLLLSVF